MQKMIVTGIAILLLSAGVAAAQSMSGQADASATPKMKAQATAHYPKAEAKLNAEEAQVTKQLNTQESQEVVSNSGTSSTSMSASGSASSSGSAPQ
jgi:hypothetical protein